MADAMSLMTISSPGEKPGIGRAAEILGISPDAVDASFGVVAIDPGRGLYAVQVRTSALPDRGSSGQEESPYRGPFSNPRIEGFGPRRK
jgi:hypothetical protein